jgi:hypothetical protein
VAKFQVSIELLNDDDEPTMRWEQRGSTNAMGAFVLLGRAFELAQRDTGAEFHAALAAFFKGAMIQKGDVVETLHRLPEETSR